MPLAPFHGWLADGYKSMPIPAVAVFSGIVSKVAAYGFLRIVLPLFPYATVHFQMLMLLIALLSILWATALAFTTPDARLVVAYSSVAQLGFITLGIFSLRPAGRAGRAAADGQPRARDRAAVLHRRGAGRCAPAARRTCATWAGIAFRAPVLAALFLIVALARLAMPGSPNFVGEFLILLGVFKSKLVIAVIAFVGVVGAAVYALRMYITSMHNRVGPRVDLSRDRPRRRRRARAARRRDPRARLLSAVRAQPHRADGEGDRHPDHRRAVGVAMNAVAAAHDAHRRARTSTGPALSPIVALAAGALVVLLVGLFRPAFVREQDRPRARRWSRSAWRSASRSGASTTTPRSSRARCVIDDLALILDLIFCVSAFAAVLLSWRAVAPARGRPRRVPLAAAVQRARDGDPRLRAESGHAVPRHRAALDPAVRAVRVRVPPRGLARVRPQVPGDRLGRLGDARLRPGADLRRHRLHRLLGDRRRRSRRATHRRISATRCC